MGPRTVLRLVVPETGEPETRVPSAPASDPGVGGPLPERNPQATPSSRGGHRHLTALGDDALVALASGGEMAAAECLYRRHAPYAMNLAARIAGSATDVEDIVHDAFLKAFQQLGSLRNAAAFRTWLGAIVVSGMRSRLRREKLRRLLGLSDARGAQPIDIERVASPSASPATRAELAQLYALVRTLPADDRIAWTLRCIEGHELEEAAALAGCSLATVKRRIARAQSFIDEHFVDSALTAPNSEGSSS
jgi:RNA polymerase sigma-70 factor (ECF subfamily)